MEQRETETREERYLLLLVKQSRSGHWVVACGQRSKVHMCTVDGWLTFGISS